MYVDYRIETHAHRRSANPSNIPEKPITLICPIRTDDAVRITEYSMIL